FLIRAGLSDRFVTLAAAVLDPVGHRVSLINAGHVAPMIYRVAVGRLEEAIDADRSGYPLGVMDVCRYEAVDAALEPGDALLLFTDGVTDALNPRGEQFRLDGIRKALAGDTVLDEGVVSPR